MVEATDKNGAPVEDDAEVLASPERSRRFPFDWSLLTALVDRWRPETHTFYLPFREMAPTLEDVAVLLGLSIAGSAVSPPDTPANWRNDLLGWFEEVLPAKAAAPYNVILTRPNNGPSLRWFLQFQVERMVSEPTEYQVSRYLEAYLLWLFGWVLFTSSHGDSVDAHLLRYARAIADGEEVWISRTCHDVPRHVRGVLQDRASLYPHKLPLLLQLWSFQRFPLGRLALLDTSPYHEDMYHGDTVHRPTAGSLWCHRRFAHVQVTRVYEHFVEQLDRLTADDVHWESYSA